jgi:hypothetical protein
VTAGPVLWASHPHVDLALTGNVQYVRGAISEIEV